MQWLELKAPPLFVWLVFAAAMLGVAQAAPGAAYAFPASSAWALSLALLGGAVALAGVLTFRGNRTTVNPLQPSAASSVVSTGMYRISRNPMYLGFFLGLAAWALYLSNFGAAFLLPGFLLYMTQFQIKPEERALLAKFGPEFAQYMARVRRWV